MKLPEIPYPPVGESTQHQAKETRTTNPLDSRILSHYPQIREIQKGGMPSPRMAIVYPMYGCNLDCLGCEYSSENEKGFQRLSTPIALKLFDRLSAMGTESIELCGGGEPFLHPDICHWVEHTRPLGLKFGALTNGTAFSEKFISSCLDQFAYIRVTLDAADAKVYSRVRPSKGPNPWDKVLSNFRRLRSTRDQQKLNLELSAKFLISQANWHQLAPMVSLAREIGASSAQFKALRQSPAELSPKQSLLLGEQLQQLRRDNPGFPILGNFKKLEMTRQCQLTPLQVTVDAHGEVYLCCYFLHRRESHSFGNLNQKDFKEIWESPEHRDAIEAISPKQCNNLDCRFVRYHDEVDTWMNADNGHFSFI